MKFDFKGRTLATITDKKGNPWFIAKDVCGVLGYRDTNDGTKYLDSEEQNTCTDKSSGQVRHIKIINEPGLYSLILRSRKPEAKEFKRWVAHKVLPAIRKTGGYIHGADKMSEKEIMAKALLVAQRTIEQRDKLAQAFFASDQSRKMWIIKKHC